MSNETTIPPLPNAIPTTDLSNIEAQIHTPTPTIYLVRETDKECISDICCAKIVLISISTLVIVPFAVCDVYFGTLDNTCLEQSQTDHHLAITMKTYLLATGTIEFVMLGFLIVTSLFFDVEVSDKDMVEVCGICIKYILYLFGFAWLIVGCVLFWGYTDISLCSQTIHDYLFARLIMGIVGMCGGGASGQDNQKRRGPY